MAADSNDANSQSAILMTLGELKGQMTSIQQFLATHAERMNRQEAKISEVEKKSETYAADLYKHVGDHAVLQNKKFDEQASRISKIELRIALWCGGLAVLGFALRYAIEFVMKHGAP